MGDDYLARGGTAECSSVVICYPMTGKRFGVGLHIFGGWRRPGHFVLLRLDAPVACALFPGMAAAGRVYDHLVVAEIER